MDTDQALEKLLPAFKRYYNVKLENVTAPFSAEAEFHSHGEQYFLVKAAKLGDIDSNEYVFFAALKEELTEENFLMLDDAAWKEGLSRIHPENGHRNSDVTLIILAPSISEAAAKKIRKVHQSKTYRLGIFGWSNHFAAAIDLASGNVYSNRLGKNTAEILKRTFAVTDKK